MMRKPMRVMLAFFLIILPGYLAGQSSRPTRVPLTIAMVEQMPHSGSPYEILRRTSGPTHDVLLVSEGVTAVQLSDGIRGVLTARRAGGDTASQALVLRVRPGGTAAANRPAFPWVRRVLADLDRASMRPLNGVGTVRWLRIWLPPQQQR